MIHRFFLQHYSVDKLPGQILCFEFFVVNSGCPGVSFVVRSGGSRARLFVGMNGMCDPVNKILLYPLARL